MTGDHLNVCKLVDWTSVIVRFSEVGPRWQKTKLLFLMSLSSATVSSSSWKTLRHSQPRWDIIYPMGYGSTSVSPPVGSAWKKGRLLSSILTWTHNHLNGLLLTVLQALYLYDCHPKNETQPCTTTGEGWNVHQLLNWQWLCLVFTTRVQYTCFTADTTPMCLF